MTDRNADNGLRVDANWTLGTPPHARTVGVAIDDRGYALGREDVDDLIARLAAVREQTWPPAGPVSRRECPLPACTWFHDEPDWPMSLALMQAPTVEQLEQARLAFGNGPANPLRDANLANLLIHTQRVETILREHFQTHTMEEWVLEVVRLQSERTAMAELVISAFALEHHAAVMSRAVKPYRFWAECPVAACGWTGQYWPSAVIAEAEGRLHRLANCEHPGAMSIASLGPQGATLLCTECGIPVTIEKDVRGRHLILAASDA